jgi:hypothetical protein
MAQTRAISRVCRSAFAHVVVLIDSDLSTTPAEEVPFDGFEEKPQEKRPANAPTMRAKEVAATVVDPQAEKMDKRINHSPLEAGEKTGRYKSPPDLDGHDLAGVVLELFNGDPHRAVVTTVKGGRKTTIAGQLVAHMVTDFYTLLRWRWDSNEKDKGGKWYAKNRTECIDDLAAVLEAQAEREKLEAEADADDGEYATKLPKA